MDHSKQVLYNTTGNIVTLFFQWLIIMLIPKITNFSEAGIFTVAISICSILNHVATFSMKEHHIADQHVCYSDKDYAAVRLFTIALSFALIIPISLGFHYDLTQIAVITGYMIYRNFLHYAYIYSASLQISNHLEYVGKWTAIEGIFSFVSFLTIYSNIHNLPLAVFTMALVGGGVFFISQWKGYKRLVPIQIRTCPISKKNVKRLLLIGVPLLCSIIAPTTITALPKLILQQLDGESIAGIFGTLSTPTIIIPTLAISVFAPFITDFSTLARNNCLESIRQKYIKMCIILMGFGILCCLAAVLVQNQIFCTLYGDEIAPYTYLFAYLILGITAYSIGTIGTTVLITKKQGKEAAVASILSLIIAAVISIPIIQKYDILGATASLMIAYVLFGLLISICVYFVPISKND